MPRLRGRFPRPPLSLESGVRGGSFGRIIPLVIADVGLQFETTAYDADRECTLAHVDVFGDKKMNSKLEIDEIKESIRSVGLRATPARVATLQILRKTASPMTHADVATTLGESGIDKATAFRNLNDMTEAGLLRRTELGGNVYRFEEVREEEKDHPHPHFVCVDCGNISCLDNVKLTASSKRASEVFGEVTEILLRGHCANCK